MPTYDYECPDCKFILIETVKYEDRDLPIECFLCTANMKRVWRAAPQVRTSKTSRTFLDGYRNDGMAEEIKAAQLDSEAMNHDPKSSKYKELKAEAKARRLLSDNKSRTKTRYNFSSGDKKDD